VTRTFPFKQVDVFTSRPLLGNPVAVVFDADGLSDEEMQAVARWTNLSETTFFQPPSPESGADYLLRIFTPASELPFAGHPTVGSAHAYLERGGARLDPNILRQECGAGVLTLRPEGDIVFAETPQAEFIHEFGTSVDAIAEALGAPVNVDPPPASVGNGPVWLFTLVDGGDLARLAPDLTAVARLSTDFGITGIAAFALLDHPEEPAAAGVSKDAVHIRCFAPALGVPEDPVTGSANAALPTYLERFGLQERTGRRYTVTQGREIGRDGTVHVIARDDGRTEIGGQCVTVAEGEVTL
jgi:PhzF family phenazine biosynthesis protein